MENQELLYSKEILKTQRFSCPNCGGPSVFSPTKQKLKCKYCESLFDLPNNTVASEQNINDLLTSNQNWNEAQVIQCKNCSGKQVVNNNAISATCSFCGSINIVKTEELTGISPQAIVPFKVEKDAAVELSKRWASAKFFAPNSFKKNLTPESISGIYYPVFTFDADTTSQYFGELYENYTTTHRDPSGRIVTETHTRYFNISGTHNQRFDDVIVQASNDISQKNISMLQPFPTNKAVQYNPNYLNGYSAFTYSKSGKDCWQEGNGIIKAKIKSAILRKYTYTGIVSYNQQSTFKDISYKFVLLPIYVGHFTYKKELYNFYINGYSGKVTGKTPISGWKVALIILAVLLFVVGPIIIHLINISL